jgi:hypothetical protein
MSELTYASIAKMPREKSKEEIEENDKLKNQFEMLWKLYPRKEGKKESERIAIRNIKKYGYEQMERAVIRYANEKVNTDKQYILTGGNFFRGRITDYLDKDYNEKENEQQPIKIEVIEKIKVVGKVEGYEDYLNTMKIMPYADYLQTEHWLHFREETIKFFGNKCMICNSEEAVPNVHHRTYENRGRETFNDVIVLCNKCHKLIHGIK